MRYPNFLLDRAWFWFRQKQNVLLVFRERVRVCDPQFVGRVFYPFFRFSVQRFGLFLKILGRNSNPSKQKYKKVHLDIRIEPESQQNPKHCLRDIPGCLKCFPVSIFLGVLHKTSLYRF